MSSHPDPSAAGNASTRPRALVTGASSGIGRAFAEHLAGRDGYDLVITARNRARLDELAGALAEHGGDVEVLVADLTDPEQRQQVEERVAQTERPIDLLVNNAGFVLRKPFQANTVEEEEQLLDVHVRATLRLTKAAVDAMLDQGREGQVLNVASVAAWLPTTTYGAHKAWVLSFSQAVDSQVRRSGVRVMALCPGFVDTELTDRAGMDLRLPDVAWVDVERVVADGLADLRHGKRVSVPTKRYRLTSEVLRFAPSWLKVRDRPAPEVR